MGTSDASYTICASLRRNFDVMIINLWTIPKAATFQQFNNNLNKLFIIGNISEFQF